MQKAIFISTYKRVYGDDFDETFYENTEKVMNEQIQLLEVSKVVKLLCTIQN